MKTPLTPKSLVLILGLLCFSSAAGQTVNMNNCLELAVTQGQAVDVRLVANDSAIMKVVCGTYDTTFTANRQVRIRHLPQADTMKIYGDVAELYAYSYIDGGGGVKGVKGKSQELARLYCGGTSFTALDMSQLTRIKYLYVADAPITSLNITALAQLNVLHLHETLIDTLDVRGLARLDTLECTLNNRLKHIKFAGNTNLVRLNCPHNAITSLDVSSLVNLIALICGDNPLTTLTLGNGLEDLQFFYCSNTLLTSLDVDALTHTQVWEMLCDNNPLITSLDVSRLPRLTVLHVQNGALTSLMLNNAISDLRCENNNLTTLNVSNKGGLSYLNCRKNAIQTLDLSNDSFLNTLICDSNALTSISNTSSATGLGEFDCSHNALTSLDVSGLSLLSNLHCSHNALTTLNLNGATALYTFDGSHNALASLDLTGLTAMQSFKASHNALTALDATPLTNIRGIEVENNRLTSINVSGLEYLAGLYCSHNQLATLDIGGIRTLEHLHCEGNQLTSLDVRESQWDLRQIVCYNNPLSTAALDQMYCALRGRSVTMPGWIYPAINSTDPHHATVLATNKNNLSTKGWEVLYKDSNTEIPTTGTYVCSTNGLGSTISGNSAVRIYPNPAKDMLQVEHAEAIETLQLFDLAGKALLTQTPQQKTQTLDLSLFPSGIYLLKLHSKNSSRVHKIVKE